jgi:hypothetical protein
MGSSLSIIHSSNGQIASSNWAHSPATQSSNRHHDVGGPLLLGVQIVTFESSRQNQDVRHYLIRPTCQSPNVATGMSHQPIATINLKHVPYYRGVSLNMPLTVAINARASFALSRSTDHSLPL